MKSRTTLILRALDWLIRQEVARGAINSEGYRILEGIADELELEKEESHAEEVGNRG
jgi:hypothetical protein